MNLQFINILNNITIHIVVLNIAKYVDTDLINIGNCIECCPVRRGEFIQQDLFQNMEMIVNVNRIE